MTVIGISPSTAYGCNRSEQPLTSVVGPAPSDSVAPMMSNLAILPMKLAGRTTLGRANGHLDLTLFSFCSILGGAGV